MYIFNKPSWLMDKNAISHGVSHVFLLLYDIKVLNGHLMTNIGDNLENIIKHSKKPFITRRQWQLKSSFLRKNWELGQSQWTWPSRLHNPQLRLSNNWGSSNKGNIKASIYLSASWYHHHIPLHFSSSSSKSNRISLAITKMRQYSNPKRLESLPAPPRQIPSGGGSQFQK